MSRGRLSGTLDGVSLQRVISSSERLLSRPAASRRPSSGAEKE